jgi:hypothetical protein
MSEAYTLKANPTWEIIDSRKHRLSRRMGMASNAETILQQLQQDFQALLDYVTGPESRTSSAYCVELTLFRGVLALGAALLQLFLVSRAAARPEAPRLTPQGAVLPYYDRRAVSYYSVFGKLTFERHYFYAPGTGGCCPLDAELSLPARCYSDLLREWLDYDGTDGSYRKSATTCERILGLKLSVQALETMMYEDAGDVTAFYDQAVPEAAAAGSILVVQADGKGVPMVQASSESPTPRLAKGQKRTKKKEAVVTSLYTVAPYRRTPQEVLSALLREGQEHEPACRPQPVNKELRATLDGKVLAISRLQERAALRDGPELEDRVALSDGAEALQQQLQHHFPHYTLVLDIIHATEYLWDSANALFGEKHPERTAWVRTRLGQLLEGDTEAVIANLEQLAGEPVRSLGQVQALQRTIGYYRRNLPYMRYDHYLARGWPIGTGVIEGACAHLVKDRMEQAGMRWTKDGAQAVLDLRGVRLSGHWDAYWQFHREQQHERLYGKAASPAATVEHQVLQMAA